VYNVFAYVFGDIAYVGNKKSLSRKLDTMKITICRFVHVVTSLWFMWKDIDERSAWVYVTRVAMRGKNVLVCHAKNAQCGACTSS
jgi:hypothetical protein